MAARARNPQLLNEPKRRNQRSSLLFAEERVHDLVRPSGQLQNIRIRSEELLSLNDSVDPDPSQTVDQCLAIDRLAARLDR